MSELEQRLRDVERRLQVVEDELAIHRLIVRYGFAVDIGNADGAASVFAEDGIYDVDIGCMEGRAAVAAMVNSERHQAMVGRCAHQIGPAVVEIHSDERASATGYSRVYLRNEAGTAIYRVSYNRWELSKRNGEWLIARRTTRVLGHEEAKNLFM